MRHLVLLSLALAGSTAAAQIAPAEYAERRAALAAQLDSGIVVAFGAREPVQHYPAFAQRPSFRYLTGFLEPDAAFTLVKRAGRVTSTLYVPHPDPRHALYYGQRLSLDAIARATGLSAAFLDALVPLVDSLAERGLPVYLVGDAQSNEFAASDSLSYGHAFARALAARHPRLALRDATRLVDRLRARKSPAEVALLTRAAEISSQAHEAAMRAIRPGMRESELQAIVESTFRRLGADRPAYASIVGSGPNSTVLHYDAGARVMRPGEVVVMDVAAEYQGYAADITRTLPVSGTFTADQRAIYQIVLDAQRVVERLARPGVPRAVPWDSATAVVKAGLARLGLVQSPDATFDAPPGLCPTRFRATPEAGCPQWYLYSYHGYGHGLGLDVHDLAQYSDVPPFAFQSGDVFTIEPGIYVRANVFDDLPDTPRNRAMLAATRAAAERYRNVGVRIEDDFVVVPGGIRRISTAPREARAVEAMRVVP